MNKSITGVAVPGGHLYNGACLPGDVVATPEDIAEWQAARLPTKAQRIAALLAPYKLERISIQMVVGMAELRADLTAVQTGGATTREADLANSFARNTAYRVSRTLENACLAIEAAP
jgi:hypothetical protein